MLSIGWPPHQPSDACDDVSTPVHDRALVIVTQPHILESVHFPLPESLMIYHLRYDLLDTIPFFEASETQSCVSFHWPVVIVRLHSLLLDLTLDIFVLFTRRKRIVGSVLKNRVKAALRVAFPWLSNVMNQRKAGAGAYVNPQQRWQ